MTDHDVPGNDMRTFPWRPRPEAGILDALCAGNADPGEAPAGLRPVAEILALLQAPPDRSESAGWDQALTAYLAAAGMSLTPRRPRLRRPNVITSLLSTKLAAAGAAAAVAAFGGGIAAAYTGSLPAGLQQFAHSTIAAPGARASHPAAATTGPGHPAGPSAAGSAGYGLCNAYEHAQAHGNATQRAVAFRNLVKAAGGASKVAAYCAQVPHPGTASPPGQQSGSAHPSHPAVPAHPAPHGKPTSTPGNGSGGGNSGGAGNSGGNGHGKGNGS